MTGILIWIMTRTGLSARAVKLWAVGILIVALFVGWNLFLADVRRDALRDAAAKVERLDRKADAKAAETRRADDARTIAEIQALERIKPDAPFVPVPAAEQRRFDCIRLQQRARRNGQQPPACDGPVLPR